MRDGVHEPPDTTGAGAGAGAGVGAGVAACGGAAGGLSAGDVPVFGVVGAAVVVVALCGVVALWGLAE
jgi:hypothetical protein